MTWSIVALDRDSGQLGVAVASRFFAVGAVCPHILPRVGAVSTQSLVNPYLGVQSVELMRTGVPAPAAIEAVVQADEVRLMRQLHGVDASGRAHAWTGPESVSWAGHRVGSAVSVAGNMLAGPEVVDATLAAWEEHAGVPFAERLLRALTAGELAGGDKRGRQGAALRVHGDEDYALVDLRVDDHHNPLAELWRLYQVAHERALARAELMPTRADPVGIRSYAEMDAAIAERLANRPRPDFGAEIEALERYVAG